MLAWVKHIAQSQVSCERLTPEQRAKSLAGHTNTRRLNRTEYNNTLRDLFGVDLHAGDLLPSEGGCGEGFDNAGATLFTSPVLIEKYLEAAELVLSTVLPAARDRAPSPCRMPAPAPVHRMAMKAFAKAYNVDMEEAEHSFNRYSTFAEFFTRALKSGLRPIDPGAQVVVNEQTAGNVPASCGWLTSAAETGCWYAWWNW